MNVRKVRGKVGSDLYCVKGDENLRPLAESHGTHIMTPITSLHDCITFGTTQPKQSTKVLWGESPTVLIIPQTDHEFVRNLGVMQSVPLLCAPHPH